ncbi:MAG: hypothetical protein R3D26_23995 [Cyanobacteriota/Melainabacteria group bacterium]
MVGAEAVGKRAGKVGKGAVVGAEKVGKGAVVGVEAVGKGVEKLGKGLVDGIKKVGRRRRRQTKIKSEPESEPVK